MQADEDSLTPEDWTTISQRMRGPMMLEQAPPQSRSREDLERWLTQHITHVLDHEFEALVQLMYRLDVPEMRFNQALAKEGTDARATAIAKLMVDREMIRIEMRRRFGN